MATGRGRVAILLNEIDGIELDCVFEESVSADIKKSDHPRELDTLTTDHAVLMPVQISITAGISNHNINRYEYDPGRISDAYERLSAIQTEMRLLTLSLGISIHRNMMFKKFLRTRRNTSGQVLDFTAVFEETFFVGDQREILVQSLKQGAENPFDNAQDDIYIKGTTNAGSASNKAIDTNSKKNQSIASRIF